MIEDSFEKNLPLPRQYGNHLLVLESGTGCRLKDRAGRTYLDMGSGIAVNSLGYGRDDLADIASQQMRRLIHVSNLFATKPQLELAGKIIRAASELYPRTSFEAVHFGNSGAEANETAIKYARLHGLQKRGEQCRKLLAFDNSFHGRTLGALSLTGNESYRTPFEPLIPGCGFLPLNDIEALEAAVDETVCGIFVEPIQGEGGLLEITKPFAKKLNELCRKHEILLISDEVQTGLGRCGTLFAGELYGLEPDMISLAKPLAGGLPLSALLVPEKVNSLLQPGHHATTFGGGPVTTAVASFVWDTLSSPRFLEEVKQKGVYIEACISREIPGETRGQGLLRGIRPARGGGKEWCAAVVSQCLDAGLIILRSGTDVLRFAPPLVIEKDEIDEGLSILFDVVRKN